MALSRASDIAPAVRVPLAGLLAWLLPGLGHIFLGQKTRGIIILITITVTYWGGVAIGGVRDTVDPQQRTAWFMAQTCAGLHTLAAYQWANTIRSRPDPTLSTRANHRESEAAVVYTGVAGLLNLLVILDALSRADVMVSAATGQQGRRKGVP
jgi:hypothetical protein